MTVWLLLHLMVAAFQIAFVVAWLIERKFKEELKLEGEQMPPFIMNPQGGVYESPHLIPKMRKSENLLLTEKEMEIYSIRAHAFNNAQSPEEARIHGEVIGELIYRSIARRLNKKSQT
jgi:hypothetical protein